MAERTVTDAKGNRWDIREREGEGEGDRFRLEFRHQSGERYAMSSKLGVNSLSDRQLVEMIEEHARDRQPTEGPDTSADPDGYITR